MVRLLTTRTTIRGTTTTTRWHGKGPAESSSLLLVGMASVSSFTTAATGSDHLAWTTRCLQKMKEERIAKNANPTREAETWIRRLEGVLVERRDVFGPSSSSIKSSSSKDKNSQVQQPLGHVEIYKDVKWENHQGRSGVGYVQFTFHGNKNTTNDGKNTTNHPPATAQNGSAASRDNHKDNTIHWIQFIRRQKWDSPGELVDQDEHLWMDPFLWQRRGEWYLDVPAHASTPYYEEWAMHDIQPPQDDDDDDESGKGRSVSIWDKPLGDFNPTNHSRLLIELETYLVIANQIVFKAEWQVEDTLEHEHQVQIVKMSSTPPDNDDNNTTLRFSRNVEQMGSQWKVGYKSPHEASPSTTISIPRPF